MNSSSWLLAVQDRHPGEPAGGEGGADRLGEDLAVDDAWDGEGRESVHQRVDGQIAQALRRLVRAADSGCERLSEGLGVGQRLLGQRERPALHDRSLEEAPGAGGYEVGEHRQATGGLAGDGHVARIAAELIDVALHPTQCGLLIHQPVVAGRAARSRRQRRVSEEPERTEAVVDGDDDRSFGRQLCRVVVPRPIGRRSHPRGSTRVLGDPRRHGRRARACRRSGRDNPHSSRPAARRAPLAGGNSDRSRWHHGRRPTRVLARVPATAGVRLAEPRTAGRGRRSRR